MRVIKVKNNLFKVYSRKNYIHDIIDELAKQLNYKSKDGKTQIRKVRELIIREARKQHLYISKRDIKRLEYPDKCKIPTNAGKILEKVAEQMLGFRGKLNNSKMPVEKPSKVLIYFTIKQLDYMSALLQQSDAGASLILNSDAIEKTCLEIEKFDNLYNNDINNLL